MVQIKENVIYKYTNADRSAQADAVRFEECKWETVDKGLTVLAMKGKHDKNGKDKKYIIMENLQQGKYYHIYNRGNNSENLFREPANYEHFLCLYDKYINPVAQTYAWCLMPNHFHLLVRIKENVVYKYTNADRSAQADAVRFEDCKWETVDKDLSACNTPNSVKEEPAVNNVVKIPKAHLHFSHFFNAYTKYINKRYARTGSLFERRFKRIEVSSEKHFRQLVIYIHTNPVHHEFTNDFKDYPWTSYGTVLSLKPTKLERSEVLGWFDDKANFVAVHNQKPDKELISNLMIE